MKKLPVSERLYEEWDPLREKLEAYRKAQNELMKYYKKHGELTMEMILYPPKEPGYMEVSRLLMELNRLPRAMTGRSRKKSDELVLVPRDVLNYIVEKAGVGIIRRGEKNE